MTGTLFRGGIYTITPSTPIELPNAAWTIGVKMYVPFHAEWQKIFYPGMSDWSNILSVGDFGAGWNELKWYINTGDGWLSTNYLAKDKMGSGGGYDGIPTGVVPIPDANIWMFLRRHADGTWGHLYVEEGPTGTNLVSQTAPSTLTGVLGGMNGGNMTQWMIGNISDFQSNTGRNYWFKHGMFEFFIANHYITDQEAINLASTNTPVAVPAIVGQSNLIRYFKFDDAPDVLVDLSDAGIPGFWDTPDYGATINSWYPTESKLIMPVQHPPQTYTAQFSDTFTGDPNTPSYTPAGVTIATGSLQILNGKLMAGAFDQRARARLTTIPTDHGYLKCEFKVLSDNNGAPTFKGGGLLSADGLNGYYLTANSNGSRSMYEVTNGSATVSVVPTATIDDANVTYTITADDGFISFYRKLSGSSVAVLQTRMINRHTAIQLYPTIISEITAAGFGKGFTEVKFETALTVGATGGGGGGGGTTPGITFELKDASANGAPALAAGTTVTLVVYEDGTPDVVETYTSTTDANGSVTFTDAAWTVGATKNCIIKAGTIRQGGIQFTVLEV